MALDLQPREVRTTFPRLAARGGFTLVELLVSTAIMLIVILVLLQVIAGMTNIWHTSTGSISTYQSARAAFTTITRTLSRATLKTYIDYVDAANNPVTNATVNSTGFVAVSSFARASELHFVCGPTANVALETGTPSSTPAAATEAPLPGDCAFFQAPLGITTTNTSALPALASTDKFLSRGLNTVGFYVEYNSLSATGTLPTWLKTALGGTPPTPRFRLMEYIEPSENVKVYQTLFSYVPTTLTDHGFPASVAYINTATNSSSLSLGSVANASQNVVLAENIVLLLFRPRLEPADEQVVAGSLTPAVTYNATTANSIISPNYNYDSHAWWNSSGSAYYGYSVPLVLNTTYAARMRNQLPPIVDVAMVAVDPNSIVRLGSPATLPANSPLIADPSLFGGFGSSHKTGADPSSASMDADLATFGAALSKAHIRYRIFRSSVQMEGAGWVNK